MSKEFSDLRCLFGDGIGSVQNIYSICGKRSILNEARQPDQESSILANLLISLVSFSMKGI